MEFFFSEQCQRGDQKCAYIFAIDENLKKRRQFILALEYKWGYNYPIDRLPTPLTYSLKS